MQIRCKFGQLGPGKGQFNSPHGFCLGLEEEIIVADTNNHRIQVCFVLLFEGIKAIHTVPARYIAYTRIVAYLK